MSTQNKKVVERIFGAVIEGGDPSVLNELISPNFVHHGIPNEKPGVEGFKETLRGFQTAFPDMKIHVEEYVGEGNQVATRGYMTGTHRGDFMGIPPTRKEVRFAYIDWWTIENGLATENWVQLDMATMMAQLGLQPATAEAH